MAYMSRSLQRGALLASTAAVLGLLTACGGSGGVHHSSPPHTSPGTAAPAADGTATSTAPPKGTGSAPADDKTAASASRGATASAGGGTTTGAGAGARCHTSELRASVGRDNPGAGQENFPIVLTNRSGRTCAVRGYPGAAFVNASGTQLGPDPRRTPGSAVSVVLKPGQSAWAGMTFSNPQVSGASTATPSALVITPPNERDPLKVAWTAGPVPVSGNASSVFLTVFAPGTGA
ncbi:DUF4232 domain-containing protein [Streptomyces sp. NPDC006739]|uniref:DUF4232 domain-containing protein n=1 Tax=Streptomyces sp. NPDC006739 TaxID=3364763 RepID=UPI0036A4BF55